MSKEQPDPAEPKGTEQRADFGYNPAHPSHPSGTGGQGPEPETTELGPQAPPA